MIIKYKVKNKIKIQEKIIFIYIRNEKIELNLLVF